MDKLTILKSECRELQSRFKSLRHFSDEKVELSEKWAKVAKALAGAEPTPQHLKNLQYALYWEAVSRGTVAQVNGDFKEAKRYAAAAGEAAKNFRTSRKFFPNTFFDETEIASHDVYLEAVQAFRDGRFEAAAENFEKWVVLNRHRHGKGDRFFDRNEFHHELCRALNAVEKRSDASPHWIQLENLLSSPDRSISRATRALWDCIEPLKALIVSGYGAAPEERTTIERLLWGARDGWKLLLGYTPPLGEKVRTAALEEPVRLPTFVDVFHRIRDVGEFWRFLLLQSLRNSLVLKADYETRFHAATPAESKSAGVVTLKPFEIERLTNAELVKYIRTLMAATKDSDVAIFDKSAPLWWDARRAARDSDQGAAVVASKKFYNTLRSLPHVIRVASCEAMHSTGGRVLPATSFYKTVAERIWSYPQTQLTLETKGDIRVDSYHYMRPRWNRRLKPYYRQGRDFDPILETRVPEIAEIANGSNLLLRVVGFC